MLRNSCIAEQLAASLELLSPVDVGSYWECDSNEYVFIVTMITERDLKISKNVYEPRIVDMLNISNHDEKRELFLILPFSFHGIVEQT
jgi:hypothetical protein